MKLHFIKLYLTLCSLILVPASFEMAFPPLLQPFHHNALERSFHGARFELGTKGPENLRICTINL